MRLKVSNVCQLLDKSKYPANITEKGITFTNNGDGTITANGTGTENYASYDIIKIPRPPIGHKILVLPENNYNMQNHIFIWGGTDDGVYRDDLEYGGNILTITGIGNALKRPYTTISVSLNVNKDWVMNNHIYKPQIFDLTEMYGAGNEPTTVEQFRQDFPNELYDYSPVCWKKFSRLKYVTETKNLLDYNKFNPIWKTNGIISDLGYLSKPASTFNTSLFYTVSGYSVALSDVSKLLQLKGTYTFSISSISIGDIYIMKYNADGTMNKQIGVLTNIKKVETLTFDELTYVDIKIQKEIAVIVTGLMVQEGSTAFPYQPYGYLPLRRGKFIANKEPVNTVSFY